MEEMELSFGGMREVGITTKMAGTHAQPIPLVQLTYIMHLHGGQEQEIGRSGAMKQPGNKRECRSY